MSRLTKAKIEERKAIVSDKKRPLAERKAAHGELMEAMMNPKTGRQFDPSTFDPMEGVDDYEVKRRERVEPPKRLPTFGMKPKKILEGQMIGQFESKQDLYLLIAWLSERVSNLEDEVKQIRGG